MFISLFGTVFNKKIKKNRNMEGAFNNRSISSQEEKSQIQGYTAYKDMNRRDFVLHMTKKRYVGYDFFWNVQTPTPETFQPH